MPLGQSFPFGLRDVKLKPLDATGTPGTSVDLPSARTFSFSENQDNQELRGDDVVVASHGSGPTVGWNLEAGGISLEAYAVIAGGTLVASGTTPAQKKVLTKLGVDARPYFQVEGQVISDSGGDFHAVVFRCKATGDIGGEFAEGSFFLTAAEGTGYPHPTSGKLYELTQNETAVAAT